MLESFKNKIEAIAYNHPKFLGFGAFALILTLTMSLSYGDYRLLQTEEQNQVDAKLNEIEKSLNSTLNDAISAGKTLAFLANNYPEIPSNFEEIGKQILQNNPSVDVLQLLDSGKVVANYPSSGNEAVMGYDILQNGPRFKEAQESILRKEMLFAGPLQLIQGGNAIIGRLPFFKDGKLSGFSSVIIYMETLLKAVEIQNSEESPFHIQFSKTNPNSGVLENFLPEPSDVNKFSEIKSSDFLGSGNWFLTVQLKESTALRRTIPAALLRIVLAVALGIVAWSFLSQPSLLAQKVKEQSQTILESNEQFEYATRATSEVIWDWDLLTDQVYRSELFMEKYGYINSPEINKAEFWTGIIHPDDREGVAKNLERVFASQETYWEQEFRIQTSDQSYAYVCDKGYIIRDQQMKAIRMIGATEDITNRKKAHLEIAKEKEKLENVLRGTEAGTWEWNVQTGETSYSESWATMIGYTLSELEPVTMETWKKLVNPQDLKWTLLDLEIHLEGNNDFYESEYRMAHKNGSCVWILDRGKVSSWTEDGKPLMMFGTHLDISKKKAQEETLLIANKKLKNANEELQIFATLASHDMREPLRMISSFMSLLQKKYGETLDQKANQYIHFAVDGAQRLTFLINDLLEYYKIGFDGENRELIETKKLIEEIIPFTHRLIYEKDAKIILGNLPNIFAVKTPIRTLFRNLIGNALLFTREGVAPSIEIEGKETEEFWEFSIEDNGIGIDSENLPHIFGILNKVNTRDDYKRTGMGLATAKKIVNQHGGSIWVNSTPHEGSTFFFTLKKL